MVKCANCLMEQGCGDCCGKDLLFMIHRINDAVERADNREDAYVLVRQILVECEGEERFNAAVYATDRLGLEVNNGNFEWR